MRLARRGVLVQALPEEQFTGEKPRPSIKAVMTFAWLERLEEGRRRRYTAAHPRHPRHKSRFPRLSGPRGL